jgi:hypothetical protein
LTASFVITDLMGVYNPRRAPVELTRGCTHL